MTLKRIVLKTLRLAALPCLLLLSAVTGLRAGSNLEEKVKYERAMEEKVEAVLGNLLGPGKAKVMIQASIDFSVREDVLSGEGGGADGAGAFKWQNINRPAATGGAELLPGFPVASRLNSTGEGASGKSQREITYPQAMIKRLTVSLVLSDLVKEDDAAKMRQVVSDLLGMDIKRGDEILMMRAKFAPAWYTTETFSMLVRYSLLALIGITGMAIVAFGFLKMAGALNNMAGSAQPQKISMEMNADGTISAGGELEMLSGAPPRSGGRELPGGGARQLAGPEEQGETQEAREVIINIKPEKVGIMVKMLTREAPADIALIAVHLTPEIRSRFISQLPAEKSAEVVACMAKVRFVSPDMIGRVKEELERRLNSAVGGFDKVWETVDKASLKEKRVLIENLEAKHPEVAVQLRQRVLFIEDLGRFQDKDLALLVGSISLDQWTLAMWKVPEAVRQMVRAQLADRSWQMIEQSMKFTTPPEAKIDAAVEAVIDAAWKLIGEGRIVNPNLAKKEDSTLPAAQDGPPAPPSVPPAPSEQPAPQEQPAPPAPQEQPAPPAPSATASTPQEGAAVLEPKADLAAPEAGSAAIAKPDSNAVPPPPAQWGAPPSGMSVPPEQLPPQVPPPPTAPPQV